MSRPRKCCPKWPWWIRAGERAMLGLDLGKVLVPDKQGTTPCERQAMERIQESLVSGSGIVDALRAASIRLPVEAWCLLQSGEHTGKFGEAMREVGELLRERESRRRAFAGQLWYPVMVGCVGILVMGIILFWVVPRMREMTASIGLGTQLPWLTQNIGHLYGGIFIACTGLLGLCLGSAFGLHIGASRSYRWGKIEEALLSSIPVVGAARKGTRESRLLRQMGVLLRAGTTLPRALEMAAEGSRSQWEKKSLLQFRSSLLMGSGFSLSLRECPLFDSESVPLLEAGQESGQLDSYMDRIAHSRHEEAGWKFSQAMRFVEPAFLLFLSGAIGGMILAYLLPMVRLLEQAGSAF